MVDRHTNFTTEEDMLLTDYCAKKGISKYKALKSCFMKVYMDTLGGSNVKFSEPKKKTFVEKIDDVQESATKELARLTREAKKEDKQSKQFSYDGQHNPIHDGGIPPAERLARLEVFKMKEHRAGKMIACNLLRAGYWYYQNPQEIWKNEDLAKNLQKMYEEQPKRISSRRMIVFPDEKTITPKTND